MTLAAQIGTLHERHEQMERQCDFISLAKMLLASGGKLSEASHLAAKAPRVSARVREILSSNAAPEILSRALEPVTNAAVPAHALVGSVFADYAVAAGGFAAALANVGIFDRLLTGGFRRLPLQLFTVGAVTARATGAVVSEGSAKPVSSLTLTSATTTVRKAMAAVFVTNELVRTTEDTDGIIGTELRNATVAAIDAQFISIASSGVTAVNSVGSSAGAFRADLGGALASISVDQNSRLYIVMTSANAKALCALGDAAGSANSAFPQMSPRGGMISGIEVLISDAPTTNSWLLIDATAFAAASGDIALSSLKNASVNMDTSPDSPAVAGTNLQSLWQLNMSAVLAERFFFCERLRTGAVAIVQNATYASGFSP
jgi:hypothetical protein